MMKPIKYLLLMVPVFFVTGCGIFSADDVERPAELVDFNEEVRLTRVWRDTIGNGQGDKYNRLTPAIEGDVIYAAANNGVVKALNKADGREIWRVRLNDYVITGGVGIGGNLLLLGTENARVVALDKTNGELQWVAAASSEVLAAPVSNGNIVIAQSIDGSLEGFSAATGERIWIYENTVPALTLRGTSTPVIINNFVIAGMGNGLLVSVAIDNGTLRWEQRIALPTGSSEIDRIVDIDGEILISGSSIVASSYQGFLTQLDFATGRIVWRVPESSYVGAATGFGNIYVSGDRSHIKAYRSGQDTVVWQNDQLDLRQVSAPVAFSNYVAVGDFDGYLHLLSQVDGRFVGRTRVHRDGLRRLIVDSDILYAYANNGRLVALRVQ